jgi:signal transduction histidine kinase
MNASLLDDVVTSLKLGDDDRARLTDLHARLSSELPAIADRFHDVVVGYPAVARFAAGGKLAGVRAAVIDWMSSGLLGPYDHAFHDRRSRIAHRCVTLGLPQHAMVAAINLFRGEYRDRIVRLYPADEACRIDHAVDKLLDIELALILGHYLRDSEHKLFEREHRIQSDRLTAIQTMSAGLAHEVRNPLNSAKLQLELLERRLRREHDDPRLVEPIELAYHEIERLTRLLNEFLAFARPADLDLGKHDVVEIAQTVIAVERGLADKRGATIRLICDPPVIATIDPHKLRQILQNLIRNALEAVSRGGLVTIELRGDEDRFYLAVGDNGPGIPPAILNRIYEPFFSTKDGGTGLGMSIVHSMVTLHGGKIRVDTGSRGTRFEVDMPRNAVGSIE